MRKILCVGVLILSIGAASAQERTWKREHVQVAVTSEEDIVAEYTAIETSDAQSPNIARDLYRDDDGHLLVIRQNSTFQPGTEESDPPIVVSELTYVVEYVASGETMTISVDTTSGSVSSGAESVAFDPNVVNQPVEVMIEAAGILSAVSPEFRTSLRNVAEVGASYSFRYTSLALFLQRLFFKDIPEQMPFADSKNPTGVLLDFDPSSSSPDEFDLMFGDDYFQ